MKIGVGFAVRGVRKTINMINKRLIKNIKDKQKFSVKEVAAIGTQMLKAETDGMKYATGAMHHAIGFKFKAYKGGKIAWVAIGVRRGLAGSRNLPEGVSLPHLVRRCISLSAVPNRTL
jgi:hypothetical protein